MSPPVMPETRLPRLRSSTGRHGTSVNSRLKELLQGVTVALQAGHQAPDLGLVHERQRDPLQMGVHGAAQVDQQPLVPRALDQRVVDHGAQDEGDRDLARDGTRVSTAAGSIA